jgi:tripartite-type tricarboxylate transporter receptor subunit TctC
MFRRKSVSKFLVIVAAICLLTATPTMGAAADYPRKPVSMIVTYAAGGGTDVIFRAASSVIHQYWGQPLIVVNKPGAGGTSINTGANLSLWSTSPVRGGR